MVSYVEQMYIYMGRLRLILRRGVPVSLISSVCNFRNPLSFDLVLQIWYDNTCGKERF